MSDPIFRADGADEALQRAVTQAQRSFKFFWRELSWEYRRIVPALDSSAIKVAFPTDTGPADRPEAEMMWVGELDFDGHTITGVLLNEPQWVRGVSSGDRVAVAPDELIDWMYTADDRAFGAFTVQAMRASMSPEERRRHDEAWELEFGDPSVVHVAAAPVRTEDRSWAADRANGLTPDEAEASEHPMSLNAGPSLAEAIEDQPEIVTSVDEDGWTILHREALAGNLHPVEALLAAGADPTATNPRGETPLDLARSAPWPRVVAALESAPS